MVNKRCSGASTRMVISEKKVLMDDITFVDFDNPWNYFQLFLQSDQAVLMWLQMAGLLLAAYTCTKCKSECYVQNRQRTQDGYTWRCKSNPNHEYSARKLSFLREVKYTFGTSWNLLGNF